MENFFKDKSKQSEVLSEHGRVQIWSFKKRIHHMVTTLSGEGIWKWQTRSNRDILSGILETQSRNLNLDSIQALTDEWKIVLNSCPLWIKIVSDVNSPVQLVAAKVCSHCSPDLFGPDLFYLERHRRV